MSKEVNDLSDWTLNDLCRLGIVALVHNEEEFPRRCGQEDPTMKEAWSGRGKTGPNLARGTTHHVPYVFVFVGWLGTPHENWGMYSPPEL